MLKYVKLEHFFGILLLCSYVVSKKISLPNLNEHNSKKLSECQRCKVFVESFNYWLHKTSRGKFEGGDAAWEESKLRSYSRSEIRLVEIQEGLCSELNSNQDQCYSLSEEAEHAIESWWFNNDPKAADLHSWLCIETLKYCCPQNHFGDKCDPCPLDKNSKICGGHGICDGEGTRKGTGGCICQRSYSGKFCEECAKNFYRGESDECRVCHKSCDGCMGEGADACTACNPGWQFDSGVCVDVDECSNPTACETNQYCVNKEGLHSCKACDRSCKSCQGPGAANCTSCDDMHAVLWSGLCVDNKLKYDLLSEAIKRLAVYTVSIVGISYVGKKFSFVSPIGTIMLSVYMYYSETTAKVSCYDIVLHHFREF